MNPDSKGKIGVIGDGGWGTTLALLLDQKGVPCELWSHDPEYVGLMREKGQNPKFLPGIDLPASLSITDNLKQVVSGADAVIVAVPSAFLPRVMDRLFQDLGHGAESPPPLVSVAKGLEEDSCLRMTEVIERIFPHTRVAALSGPTLALEIARGLPASAVVASKDAAFATQIQKAVSTEKFRLYTSEDVVGVELGGALKNVIAIAAGIADGLGFGVNAKSALVSRGLAEITRLGVAMGARAETFAGLSGVGDLVTTCTSTLSRNHTLGEGIGQGKSLQEMTARTEMVTEGVHNTLQAVSLAGRFGVEMPIAQQVSEVLFRGKDPRQAVVDLMTRSYKTE
ncbi:MAG: NAD(P)-dependent glycerol-3-phosphate dehydrogenase [Candidatus Omnitrophica bacterium]|nr:NAD(P)-dependent glycerol-3-phosphate dehydrogenase [Candidatus Omnitrophota bacterium]